MLFMNSVPKSMLEKPEDDFIVPSTTSASSNNIYFIVHLTSYILNMKYSL